MKKYVVVQDNGLGGFEHKVFTSLLEAQEYMTRSDTPSCLITAFMSSHAPGIDIEAETYSHD